MGLTARVCSHCQKVETRFYLTHNCGYERQGNGPEEQALFTVSHSMMVSLFV
jgi:hypothetical protein